MSENPDGGASAADPLATDPRAGRGRNVLLGRPVIGAVLAVAAFAALVLIGTRRRRSAGLPGAQEPRSATPLRLRVFATREGLVGGQTANGHIITAHDHFVALPSRRGLSPKGGTTKSVKIDADNGRSVIAPVWDVGPWNTTDDYWNPPSVRQSWTNLPQGTPEAQAAFQNGYNGGKNEKGHPVTNPAGIDLADGTFWDDLELTGNAWVWVTFLWT
ncbi:hypothetical protein [Pseudonocardia terrae]|uniref:hypothetical protein n=1 Tax=Pseudonocardia terrae TaxID=2905831 RepID=UPI0035583C96